MPLVDDDDKEININEPWVLQTQQQQQLTNNMIESFREELEEEHGTFTTRNMPSGRVLLEPQDGEPLICYMSDPKALDPRLVVDDFTPEIWPEWWPVLDPKVEDNRNRQPKQI